MANQHCLEVGKPVKLSELTTRGKDLHQDRDAAEREFEKLRCQLVDLQNRLYAEGQRKLLVVFQATDAGGKDGTIRHVFKGVNPQGVRVTSFKKPTDKELAHDFLWRIHQEVPAAGMIGVFNRSHYEDVLVVRVRRLVSKTVWRARYEQINEFEHLLVSTGTKVVKFYLHISKDEQAERFQARIDDPEKHWKFNREDLDKRKLWNEYEAAYEDMLSRCTTKHAPWHVIPADQKWYRNLAVTRVLVDTLQGMDPRYPEPDADISDTVFE